MPSTVEKSHTIFELADLEARTLYNVSLQETTPEQYKSCVSKAIITKSEELRTKE